MKLAEWLRLNRLTQQEFGSRIGASQAQVARFAADKRVPNRDTMVRIASATGGMVTANDFFDLTSAHRSPDADAAELLPAAKVA